VNPAAGLDRHCVGWPFAQRPTLSTALVELLGGDEKRRLNVLLEEREHP
jgi:hypothetical protein